MGPLCGEGIPIGVELYLMDDEAVLEVPERLSWVFPNNEAELTLRCKRQEEQTKARTWVWKIASWKRSAEGSEYCPIKKKKSLRSVLTYCHCFRGAERMLFHCSSNLRWPQMKMGWMQREK